MSSIAGQAEGAGPSIRSVPDSSQIARSHVSVIVLLLWLTRKTVPASLRSSAMRSLLRFWNRASPVDSASSISSTSWVLAAAIEKRSRAPMPEEYVRIGRVMKSPFSLIPENSTMSA